MDQLVSVIIPVYNAEKYVSDAIESVLKQSYKSLEIILVDDCSTDRSLEIIESFRKVNSNVIVLKNKKNMGVSHSRNVGMKKASGDYIAFLDSDDTWHENKLEKQIEFHKKNNSEITFTASYYINSTGKTFPGVFEVPYDISYRQLLRQNVISCSSSIISKEIASKYEMRLTKYHEDYIFWLEILKQGGKAHGLNEPLLYYRIHGNQKTGNKFRSVQMTWKTYRYMGLNLFQSLLYLNVNCIRVLKKNYLIRKGNK